MFRFIQQEFVGAGFCMALVLFNLGSAPDVSAQPDSAEFDFRISVIDSADIGPIPRVNWLYDIDAADGYIATIDREARLFQLFGPGGEIFRNRPDSNGGFWLVRIQPNVDIILVAEASKEFGNRWIGYDYSGRVVFGPVNTSQPLRVSPDGKICYSVYDVGEDISKPVLYDVNGHHLATFLNHPRQWDIKILDDSLLVYRNIDTIRIISYPAIDTISEFVVPLQLLSHFPHSAVTRNGSHYAFLVRGNIIVCNLISRQVYTIPDDTAYDKYFWRDLALTDDGEFLILNQCLRHDQSINIYAKRGSEYAEVVDSFVVPLPGEYEFWGFTILMNRYCAISYQTRVATGLIFNSFLFDFTISPDEGIKGELLDGMVTVDSNNDDPARFRLTSTDSGYARTKLCRIDFRQ